MSKLLRRAGEGPAPCSRQASVSLQDHGEGLSTAPPFPCVTLSLVLPTPAGKPGPAAPHLHTSSSSPHPLLIRSPIRSLQAPWSTISRVLRDLTPDRIPLLPFPASLQLPARAPAPLCVPVCEGWSPMDHLHREDVGRSMWFVAVFLMPRDAPDTWLCFDPYLSNTWKKMHAWRVCLQGSAPALPFPADFLSVDLSVCVRLPRWVISAGTVTPCFDISMKTIKVRTHCGLPFWMLCVPACGVTPLGPAPPTPGTAHGDVPPCLRPPPITGSSPRAGEHLASLARGHQTLVHGPGRPGPCSCK